MLWRYSTKICHKVFVASTKFDGVLYALSGHCQNLTLTFLIMTTKTFSQVFVLGTLFLVAIKSITNSNSLTMNPLNWVRKVFCIWFVMCGPSKTFPIWNLNRVACVAVCNFDYFVEFVAVVFDIFMRCCDTVLIAFNVCIQINRALFRNAFSEATLNNKRPYYETRIHSNGFLSNCCYSFCWIGLFKSISDKNDT